MSRPYRLTERAEADVDAIADFIAGDSVDAAVKVVLALEDAFVLLASRSGIGHARTDLTDRPLKFWTVHSYLVVYDPDSDPLTIQLCTVHATSPRSSRRSAETELSGALGSSLLHFGVGAAEACPATITQPARPFSTTRIVLPRRGGAPRSASEEISHLNMTIAR